MPTVASARAPDTRRRSRHGLPWPVGTTYSRALLRKIDEFVLVRPPGADLNDVAKQITLNARSSGATLPATRHDCSGQGHFGM